MTTGNRVYPVGSVGLQVGGSSISSSNPLPIKLQSRVGRTTHLSSGPLPASGAYTSQTAYTVPDGVNFIMFYVTYTRGAASGQAKCKVMVGNGTEEGPLVVVDPSVSASEPFSQQTIRGGEFKGPVPQDGSAITFVVPVSIRGGITTIRLLAAEVGVTATPGTCAIALTGGYST